MVAGAHGDAESVEQCAHVKVVDVAYEERNDGVLALSRAEDAYALDLSEPPHGILRQLVFVPLDVVHAQGRNIVDGLRQPVGGHIVGRSRLELERKVLEHSALEADTLNHLSPTLIRRQAVEPAFLAVKHADSRRAVHLVAAEGEEVAVHRLHVYREVGRALCSVNHHGNAMLMGDAYDFVHRIDRSEYVADVRHADNLRPPGKQLLVFVEHKFAPVGHRNDAYGDAFLGRLKLPRHNVGVVFHDGDDYFVALLHERIAERGGHEVKALGGSARKYHLVC